MITTGVSSPGFVPSTLFQPLADWAARTQSKLQRGYVPIRVSLPRPALPTIASPFVKMASPFVDVGPQMAYDPQNINSGLVAGFNDIDPDLGLPAIPAQHNLAGGQKEGGLEASEAANLGTTSEVAAETSLGEKVVLPPGLAMPICNSSLVIIEGMQSVSGEQVECESLDDTKKKLGASAFAAIEEIFDAQALLEDQKDSILMLPEGAKVETSLARKSR